MAEAHRLLAGQFTEDEAREVTDVVCDAAMEALPSPSMTVRWTFEEALLNAFGYSSEEDEDEGEEDAA